MHSMATLLGGKKSSEAKSLKGKTLVSNELVKDETDMELRSFVTRQPK